MAVWVRCEILSNEIQPGTSFPCSMPFPCPPNRIFESRGGFRNRRLTDFPEPLHKGGLFSSWVRSMFSPWAPSTKKRTAMYNGVTMALAHDGELDVSSGLPMRRGRKDCAPKGPPAARRCDLRTANIQECLSAMYQHTTHPMPSVKVSDWAHMVSLEAATVTWQFYIFV